MWHMEVPRPEAESELQLLAYATAPAIPDPSCLCDLNARPLTHWVRSVSEPTYSWMLVRFITTESQWELSDLSIFKTSQIF